MAPTAHAAPVWPIPAAFVWGVITAIAPSSVIAAIASASCAFVIDLPVAVLCVLEGALVRFRASARPLHGAFGGLLVASAYVVGSTAAMSVLQALGTPFLGKAYLGQAFAWAFLASIGAFLGYTGSVLLGHRANSS